MSPLIIQTVLVCLLTVGLYEFWRAHAKKDRYLRIAQAFSRATELRCNSHFGLSKEVELVSMQIAKELGMDARAIENLRLSTYLRDIGLSGVSYEVLNREDRTPADESMYARHPEVGASILQMIPAYRGLSPIVRAHHLSFEVAPDAPLASRILAVATDFVWFDRFVGRKVAIAKISVGAGTRYDPKVVQVLMRQFADEPEEASASLL